MSILKFKNADGTWNGIAAFKGENGKDGVVQYKAGNGIKIENDTITAEVTKQYVDKSLAELTDMGFTPEVVESLPTENIKTNIIYMLPAERSEEENIYKEWMYINNKWEMVGSTSVDLSNYYTKDEANAKLDTKQNKLTPGENITIDENNVISASAGVPTFDIYVDKDTRYMNGVNITLGVNSEVTQNLQTFIDNLSTTDSIIRVCFKGYNVVDGALVYCISSSQPNTNMQEYLQSHSSITYVSSMMDNYTTVDNKGLSFKIYVTLTLDNTTKKITFVSINTYRSKYLPITNTNNNDVINFTPTKDYHPATKKYVDDAVSNIHIPEASTKGYYYVEAPMGALGIGNEYNESNTLPETCHQVFKDFIDTINSNNVREPKLIVANTVDETTDINGNPITNPMPRYIELSNLHKDTTAEEGKSHYILKGVCNTPRGAKNANGDDIDFIATVDIVGVDSNTGFTVENAFVYLGVYTMPSASSGKTNYLGYIEDYTSNNRLDITNLEKGTYSLGIKDRIESQTLYLKVSHNGQEQTLDTKLQIEATVVSNMIYFDVRHPIKDISGYDEAIRISFSYLNSITGEIVDTKYGISYNNTSGILSNSARYNTKILATTTDTEQTIKGKKTFNVLPESSVEPTNNNQFVNKKYVDDAVAGSSGGITSETDPIFSASEAAKITASDTANWNSKLDSTQVNDILNTKSYLTSETDPTVPAWAKQPNKPTYTASEVGALPASTVIPTVPTKLSELTDDLGTSPTHSHSQYLTAHQDISNLATKEELNNIAGVVDLSSSITLDTNSSPINSETSLVKFTRIGNQFILIGNINFTEAVSGTKFILTIPSEYLPSSLVIPIIAQDSSANIISTTIDSNMGYLMSTFSTESSQINLSATWTI